jgi:hypothetical protein
VERKAAGGIDEVRYPRVESMNDDPIWWITNDGDLICRDIFNRHYSKYHYKDGRNPKKIVGPGQYIMLRTWEGNALLVWRKFKDDSGQQGINCSVFRNESEHKSSDLIRQADAIADFCWPGERHYTYVNAEKIKSNNPGCCFKKAGWRLCGITKVRKLIILEKINRSLTYG